MIILKTFDQIKRIGDSCKIVSEILSHLYTISEIGITTYELNKVAEEITYKHKAYPVFNGFKGFPYSICASVNDCVVHGFPNDVKLQNGDVLSVDFGILYKGWCGDSAFTKIIGETSDDIKTLVRVTEECLYAGIEKAVAYNKVGDISSSIQTHAIEHGFGVVEKYGGHGIGRNLHEDPFISNVGVKNKGYLLKAGMVIAIEPMLTLGKADIKKMDNGWTIKTKDEKTAAHFEHTIAITEEGPVILTGR
jgi:methionyl aminopeptidase